MRFPIDVLYLDRNKVVVHLEQSVETVAGGSGTQGGGFGAGIA